MPKIAENVPEKCQDQMVAVLPAAGHGSRMLPYKSPKELLTVGYHEAGLRKGLPKVVSEYALNALNLAGVRNFFLTISHSKFELFNFFGSGAYHGIQIGYLCQERATGMPGAIDLAYPWTKSRTVMLAMPDTILETESCFQQMHLLHLEESADLTLGVFPTDIPQRLAPVEIDRVTHRVISIEDKPKLPKCENSWGIAVWGPAFSELLHEMVSQRDTVPELLMTDMFNEANKAGMKVLAKYFPDGRFFDVGTPEGLVATRSALEYSRMLDAMLATEAEPSVLQVGE